MDHLFIGTAGWAVPKLESSAFPAEGSALARYAAIFTAAEINSTFYRDHRPSTYERWRDSVSERFRFSVKVPKRITHDLGLIGAEQTFADFVTSIAGLGSRLGPLLLQLPPKLAFDARSVEAFLSSAVDVAPTALVLEPRHPSWFTGEADALLGTHGVARAGADPERSPGALAPGGSRRLTYLRLHGSPRVYYSSYDDDFISGVAQQLVQAPADAWCIFDNTASGAAMNDALRLRNRMRV